MKVNIGKYGTYFGPYQFVNKVFFFLSEEAKDNITAKLPQWPFAIIEKLQPKRVEKVKIHNYDTWSADHTLALVIHPMLVAVKKDKYSAPAVDDEDVPAELKSTSAPKLTQEQIDTGTSDEHYFKRWDYVLDEMIWAFDSIIKEDDISDVWFTPTGYNREEADKFYDRQANGLRLFGKYYRGLWS